VDDERLDGGLLQLLLGKVREHVKGVVGVVVSEEDAVAGKAKRLRRSC
jgi:hypothetical protein